MASEVVLVVKLVGHHSCGADRLPVAVRFPAGSRVRLKTVDPPKGNGLGQKKNWKTHDVSDFQCHFWNQFLEASDRIVLSLASSVPLAALSIIDDCVLISSGAQHLEQRKSQISWQAHLEHVVICLWPAQHFQQLRIILRGRCSTLRRYIFLCGQRSIFSS